jgi:hypothetical protein
MHHLRSAGGASFQVLETHGQNQGIRPKKAWPEAPLQEQHELQIATRNLVTTD